MARVETAAPQLLVNDLASSLTWYQERLGFSSDFTYAGFYAGVSRDGYIFCFAESIERSADGPGGT